MVSLTLASGCLFHRGRGAPPVELPAAAPAEAPVETPAEPFFELPAPGEADVLAMVPTGRPLEVSPPVARRTTTPARNAPALLVVQPTELPATVSVRRQALVGAGRGVSQAEVGYYMDVQQARLQQVGGPWLDVSRIGRAVRLRLNGSWNFTVGRAELSPRVQSAIARVAAVLADYRLSLITVHGYTDASGDAAINQKLSELRALAVAGYLVSNGVAADRIVVVGHGAASPVASNDTPAGREENRRVELQVDPLAGR